MYTHAHPHVPPLTAIPLSLLHDVTQVHTPYRSPLVFTGGMACSIVVGVVALKVL